MIKLIQNKPQDKQKYRFDSLTNVGYTLVVPINQCSGRASRCSVRAQANLSKQARQFGKAHEVELGTTVAKDRKHILVVRMA
jgi:hypothetical protein